MTIRLTSLKKITELKNRMTQQVSVEYAESLRNLEAEQDKLQRLMQTHDDLIHDLHDLTGRGVPSQELHAWMQFMLTQRSAIAKQHMLIANKTEECTAKRDDLTSTFLDEQKWLRLQDRRQLEHRAHVNKLAQEALDEIAVTGHQRVRG
ncbi:MAG: flagellar export protein FliJ [Tumebacillaceae bacterium]